MKVRNLIWWLREDKEQIHNGWMLMATTLHGIHLPPSPTDADQARVQKLARSIQQYWTLWVDTMRCVRVLDTSRKDKDQQPSLDTLQVIRVFIEISILKGRAEAAKKLNTKLLADVKNGKIAHVFQYSNLFDLYTNEMYPLVRKYLEALYLLGIYQDDEDACFLCRLEFPNGYLACLYLITGPLRYFSEDWPRMLKEYSDAILNDQFANQQFLGLQYMRESLFLTWINWGPSIPVCTNSLHWRINNQAALITLQFGYGDENNSVPVVLPSIDKDGVINKKEWIDRIWDPSRTDNPRPETAPLVQQVTLRGWPTLLGKTSREHLAPAQTELMDLNRLEVVLTLGNPLSSKKQQAEDDCIIKANHDSGHAYYTSYIWILFAILPGGNGNDLNAFKDRIQICYGKRSATLETVDTALNHPRPLWRYLLPFVEHVNLVDLESVRIQKLGLAANVWTVLKEMHATFEKEQRHSMHLVYLCASDHCNCSTTGGVGESRLIRPHHTTLLDQLRRSMANEPDPEFRNAISLDTQDILPAHALPHLINRMNQYINRLQ